MPLAHSGDDCVAQNIHELKHHGTRKRSHRQIVAIAVAACRRARKNARAGTPVRLNRETIQRLHDILGQGSNSHEPAHWHALADAMDEAGKPATAEAMRQVADGTDDLPDHKAKIVGFHAAKPLGVLPDGDGTILGLPVRFYRYAKSRRMVAFDMVAFDKKLMAHCLTAHWAISPEHYQRLRAELDPKEPEPKRRPRRHNRETAQRLFEQISDAPHEPGHWHAFADLLDESGKPATADLMRQVGDHIAQHGPGTTRSIDIRIGEPVEDYSSKRERIPGASVLGIPVSMSHWRDGLSSFYFGNNYHPAWIEFPEEHARRVQAEFDPPAEAPKPKRGRQRFNRETVARVFQQVTRNPRDDSHWHALADALEEAGKPALSEVVRFLADRPETARSDYARVARQQATGGWDSMARASILGIPIHICRHDRFGRFGQSIESEGGPWSVTMGDSCAGPGCIWGLSPQHGIRLMHEADEFHGQVPYWHDVEDASPREQFMRDRIRSAIRPARRPVRFNRETVRALWQHLLADERDNARWHALADALDEAGKPHTAQLMREMGSAKLHGRAGEDYRDVEHPKAAYMGDDRQHLIALGRVAGLPIYAYFFGGSAVGSLVRKDYDTQVPAQDNWIYDRYGRLWSTDKEIAPIIAEMDEVHPETAENHRRFLAEHYRPEQFCRVRLADDRHNPELDAAWADPLFTQPRQVGDIRYNPDLDAVFGEASQARPAESHYDPAMRPPPRQLTYRPGMRPPRPVQVTGVHTNPQHPDFYRHGLPALGYTPKEPPFALPVADPIALPIARRLPDRPWAGPPAGTPVPRFAPKEHGWPDGEPLDVHEHGDTWYPVGRRLSDPEWDRMTQEEHARRKWDSEEQKMRHLAGEPYEVRRHGDTWLPVAKRLMRDRVRRAVRLSRSNLRAVANCPVRLSGEISPFGPLNEATPPAGPWEDLSRHLEGAGHHFLANALRFAPEADPADYATHAAGPESPLATRADTVLRFYSDPLGPTESQGRLAVSLHHYPGEGRAFLRFHLGRLDLNSASHLADVGGGSTGGYGLRPFDGMSKTVEVHHPGLIQGLAEDLIANEQAKGGRNIGNALLGPDLTIRELERIVRHAQAAQGIADRPPQAIGLARHIRDAVRLSRPVRLMASPYRGGRTWFAYDTYLGRKSERPCGNNRRMRRNPDGSISVILHSTPVVTAHQDGTYTLNSGGWHTVTTRGTINEFSPAHISFAQRYGTQWFYDGVRVDRHGRPLWQYPVENNYRYRYDGNDGWALDHLPHVARAVFGHDPNRVALIHSALSTVHGDEPGTDPAEKAILAQALVDPAQDAPWLAHADWLEERGQTADASRVRNLVHPPAPEPEPAPPPTMSQGELYGPEQMSRRLVRNARQAVAEADLMDSVDCVDLEAA